MTRVEAAKLLCGYFGPGSGSLIKAYLGLQLGREVSDSEAAEIVQKAVESEDWHESYGSIERGRE